MSRVVGRCPNRLDFTPEAVIARLDSAGRCVEFRLPGDEPEGVGRADEAVRVGVEQAGQRRERDDVALVSVYEVLASLRGPCKVVGKPRVCAAERGTLRLVLIILGVILLVAAVAGGIAVHGLLWLLLILALVVFAIGALTGRITE